MFENLEQTVPLSYCLFPEEYYLQSDGPVHEQWRNATSMWALGERDELEVGIRRVQADNENGFISGVISEHESYRAEVGHTVFIYGQKSS